LNWNLVYDLQILEPDNPMTATVLRNILDIPVTDDDSESSSMEEEEVLELVNSKNKKNKSKKKATSDEEDYGSSGVAKMAKEGSNENGYGAKGRRIKKKRNIDSEDDDFRQKRRKPESRAKIEEEEDAQMQKRKKKQSPPQKKSEAKSFVKKNQNRKLLNKRTGDRVRKSVDRDEEDEILAKNKAKKKRATMDERVPKTKRKVVKNPYGSACDDEGVGDEEGEVFATESSRKKGASSSAHIVKRPKKITDWKWRNDQSRKVMEKLGGEKKPIARVTKASRISEWFADEACDLDSWRALLGSGGRKRKTKEIPEEGETGRVD
jgi:hypothetical protein